MAEMIVDFKDILQVNGHKRIASVPDKGWERVACTWEPSRVNDAVEATVKELTRISEKRLPPKDFTADRVWMRNGGLSRVEEDRCVAMSSAGDHGVAGMRGILNRVMLYRKVVGYNKDTGAPKYRVIEPPLMLIQHLLHDAAAVRAMVRLSYVTSVPVLTSAGEFVQEPGYDAGSGIYYAPNLSADELDQLDLSGVVTGEDVAWAVDVLLRRLYAGVPWKDEASRANMLALGLLALSREMLKGQPPIWIIAAPNRKMGKTTLLVINDIIVHGRQPTLTPWPTAEYRGHVKTDEAELRKQITTDLRESGRDITLDNVEEGCKIKSAALEALTTADNFGGRILGSSANVNVSGTAKPVCRVTVNNPDVDEGIVGRAIPVLLMSEDPDYWESAERLNALRRAGHPGDPVAHAEGLRVEALQALYTIIRWWLQPHACARSGEQHSRLRGSGATGRFAGFRGLIGGMLECAGVSGLMANCDEFALDANILSNEEGIFLEMLYRHKKFNHEKFSGSELAQLLLNNPQGQTSDAIPEDVQKLITLCRRRAEHGDPDETLKGLRVTVIRNWMKPHKNTSYKVDGANYQLLEHLGSGNKSSRWSIKRS
jgi:hypothetical protein